MRPKRKVYQAVMLSILLYDCESWLTRNRRKERGAFDNDSICPILHLRCKDCVPIVELHGVKFVIISATFGPKKVPLIGPRWGHPEGEPTCFVRGQMKR